MIMRPCSLILVSLMFLHLLFSVAYATRIAKFGIKSDNTLHVNLEINNEKVRVFEQDDSKRVEQSLGTNKKQVGSTYISASAHVPIQEDLEKGLKKDMSKSRMNEVEHRHVSSSASTLSTDSEGEEEKKQKMGGKRHEDVMDMIEMDYSPAMKKPPIHN